MGCNEQSEARPSNLKPEIGSRGGAESAEGSDSGLRSQPSDCDELDAVSAELAAAEGDPWTPACVAAAFLDEAVVVAGVLLHGVTMRGWLRLEVARSPFVTGQFASGAAERLRDLCFALSVLSGRHVSEYDLTLGCSPQEALGAEVTVARLINEEFATVLPMRFRSADGSLPREGGDEGFGWWPRLLTRLVRDFHMPLHEATALRLSKAFALVATGASLDGGEPKGENYREREALRRAEGRKVERSEGAAGSDPGQGRGDHASQAAGGEVAEEVEDDGGEDERGGDDYANAPGEPGGDATSPDVVEAGKKKADDGGDIHLAHGEKMA